MIEIFEKSRKNCKVLLETFCVKICQICLENKKISSATIPSLSSKVGLIITSTEQKWSIRNMSNYTVQCSLGEIFTSHNQLF